MGTANEIDRVTSLAQQASSDIIPFDAMREAVRAVWQDSHDRQAVDDSDRMRTALMGHAAPSADELDDIADRVFDDGRVPEWWTAAKAHADTVDRARTATACEIVKVGVEAGVTTGQAAAVIHALARLGMAQIEAPLVDGLAL